VSCWRGGDVGAVNEEIERFGGRESGPVHPLEASFALNLGAVMAFLGGDFDRAERLGHQAVEVADGYNVLALSFYGALMMWTWWQRGELGLPKSRFREVVARTPADYPTVRAALALAHAEAGEAEEALADLDGLSLIGWEKVADDQSEGFSLAMAAAACSVVGAGARDFAFSIYEEMRPYTGTSIVIRAPAAACVGPADQFLGLLAAVMGDLALAEVHFEAALWLARRMDSAPFIAAAEVELARTLRQRGRDGEEQRVAVLLRSAEESALRLGLHRLARLAAEPG
jgi:hypothetical protein